jgi:hypothetical protein
MIADWENAEKKPGTMLHTTLGLGKAAGFVSFKLRRLKFPKSLLPCFVSSFLLFPFLFYFIFTFLSDLYTFSSITMASIPRSQALDVDSILHQLTEEFEVSPDRIRTIIKQFNEEMEKGLDHEGATGK